MTADVVTVSHGHGDHNDTSWVKGAEVVDTPYSSVTAGIPLDCVETYHDAAQGAQRGVNRIYIGELEGVRIAHLGDLGHIPTPDQYAQLDDVAVLLIPVGGHFTITPEEAAQVARQVNAPITIAMHFNPGDGRGPAILSGPEPFLNLLGGARLDTDKLEITPALLQKRGVFALRYKK